MKKQFIVWAFFCVGGVSISNSQEIAYTSCSTSNDCAGLECTDYSAPVCVNGKCVCTNGTNAFRGARNKSCEDLKCDMPNTKPGVGEVEGGRIACVCVVDAGSAQSTSSYSPVTSYTTSSISSSSSVSQKPGIKKTMPMPPAFLISEEAMREKVAIFENALRSIKKTLESYQSDSNKVQEIRTIMDTVAL